MESLNKKLGNVGHYDDDEWPLRMAWFTQSHGTGWFLPTLHT